MNSSPIKLRLYGESFKIHALNLNSSNLKDFMMASQRLNEPLEEALLNVSFFKILNLKSYDSVETMIDCTFGGLMNTSKNKIEIWCGRKCLQKFNLDDLFHPDTLFPLFNINKRKLTIRLNNNMFLIEKEIGLIAEYTIEKDLFDINNLKFFLGDIKYLNENFQLLASLSYRESKLQSIKSDSLITYRHCVNKLNTTP